MSNTIRNITVKNKITRLFNSYYLIFFLFMLMIPAGISAQEPKREEKFLLAINFEQNNEIEKAKDIYEEIYQSNPKDYNAFTSLNRMLVKLKDYEKSIKIIEEKLKTSPSDYSLYGLLGSTYYTKGETGKAFISWEQGLAILPQSVVPYRTIANQAVQCRAYEKAIEYYLLGEKNLVKKGMFINELFNLYNVLFKYDEAAVMLCENLLNQPENINIIKPVLYAYTTRIDLQDKFINTALKYLAQSGKIVFKELLAFIYQFKGENEKAFEYIKEVEESGKTNGNTVINFAHECYSNRNYRAASMAFKYFIDKYPGSPLVKQMRLYYPMSLELLLGEKKKAGPDWKIYSIPDTTNVEEYLNVIKVYEENIKLYPKSDMQNEALVRIGLIQKDILYRNNQAENTFNRIVKNNIYSPSMITALEKLAELNLLKNNYSEAEKLCNKILQFPSADSLSKKRAHFLLGKNYYWQGGFIKALEHFNNVAYDFSNDLSNDAIEISAVINSSKKDSLSLLEFAKADFMLFQRNFSGALEILQKTAQSENPILSEAAKYRLAMAFVPLNRTPEALKILEEIYTRGNSNYADNAYFSAGNIYYYELNDFRSAKEKFEKLLEIFPSSILTDRAREMLNIIKNKSEIDNDNKQNRQ